MKYIVSHPNDVVPMYIFASIICIAVFMIMGVVLSPKLGYQITAIIKLDEGISSLIYSVHSDTIDEFMILLSTYGREIVWSAVIVFMAFFAGWKGKKIAVIIVISFLIITPLNTLFKNFFERPRPVVERQEILIAQKTDFAYPSGHASIVSGGALILMVLFRKEKELIFSAILAGEAALVCLSRIYVGDHYFFDVIGGIFLGTGVALMAISLSKYLDPVITCVRKYLEKTP
ncbi:MAG TPA: phosphatase PAP2 family protein [Nitrososphaeraceae archaeon]|nr:phosphatase PAP2 family protein [Nitrososphaeraceae archaeon]